MAEKDKTYGIRFMILGALFGIGYGVLRDNLTSGLVGGMLIGLGVDLIIFYKNKARG